MKWVSQCSYSRKHLIHCLPWIGKGENNKFVLSKKKDVLIEASVIGFHLVFHFYQKQKTQILKCISKKKIKYLLFKPSAFFATSMQKGAHLNEVGFKFQRLVDSIRHVLWFLTVAGLNLGENFVLHMLLSQFTRIRCVSIVFYQLTLTE